MSQQAAASPSHEAGEMLTSAKKQRPSVHREAEKRDNQAELESSLLRAYSRLDSRCEVKAEGLLLPCLCINMFVIAGRIERASSSTNQK